MEAASPAFCADNAPVFAAAELQHLGRTLPADDTDDAAASFTQHHKSKQGVAWCMPSFVLRQHKRPCHGMLLPCCGSSKAALWL